MTTINGRALTTLLFLMLRLSALRPKTLQSRNRHVRLQQARQCERGEQIIRLRRLCWGLNPARNPALPLILKPVDVELTSGAASPRPSRRIREAALCGAVQACRMSRKPCGLHKRVICGAPALALKAGKET